MINNENATSPKNELLYIPVSNGVILLLSLVQNWSSSDLFLFLFLQSVLQGAVTLAILFLLNIQKNNISGSILHSVFFLLHYYLFIAVILFGVFYESGYLTLQTLADGLTTFFTVFIAENLLVSTQFNLLSISLTLGLFLLMLSYQSFQKYKNFNTLNRSYAEVHISAYSKHLLVFFFAFMCSAALLKPLINSTYASSDSEVANQAILTTFFITLSIIEILMAYTSKKLNLI